MVPLTPSPRATFTGSAVVSSSSRNIAIPATTRRSPPCSAATRNTKFSWVFHSRSTTRSTNRSVSAGRFLALNTTPSTSGRGEEGTNHAYRKIGFGIFYGAVGDRRDRGGEGRRPCRDGTHRRGRGWTLVVP